MRRYSCESEKSNMNRTNSIFHSAFLLLGVFLAIAASAAPARAIYNGAFSYIPAVGYILNRAGNLRCSGTLIAPKLVLTAGHCLLNVSTGNASLVEFYVSRPGANGVVFFSAADVHVYGSVYLESGNFVGQEDDVGLIMLQEPVSPLLASPILFGDPQIQFGQTVLVVGWGDICKIGVSGVGCDNNDQRAATFRWGTGLSSFLFCPGDCGGPILSYPKIFFLGRIINYGFCGAAQTTTELFAYPQKFMDGPSGIRRYIAQYGGAPWCTAGIDSTRGHLSAGQTTITFHPTLQVYSSGATTCSYKLDGVQGTMQNCNAVPEFIVGAGNHSASFTVTNSQGSYPCAVPPFEVVCATGTSCPGTTIIGKTTLNRGDSETYSLGREFCPFGPCSDSWAFNTEVGVAPQQKADRFAFVGTPLPQLASILLGFVHNFFIFQK